MIVKSLNNFAGKTELIINNMQVLYNSVIEYELSLSENKHDLLIITMTGVPPKSLTEYIGAPVRFFVGSSSGRNQEFNGYVSYTEPLINNKDGFVNKSPVQLARLYCIGASYSMKEIRSKVWDYPSLTDIINDITSRYRFSVDYPKETYRPVRLVQSMESDWAFLNRVCKTFGLSFTLHGTHLHIWNRDKANGRLTSYHKAITSSRTQSNQPFSVINFEGTLGRVSSSTNASKSTITVLDNQNNIHTVTSDGTEYNPGDPSLIKLFKKPLYYSASSLEEGLRMVDSTDKYNYVYNASIKVLYGAGAVPGGVIDLDGYSSDFDGLWYITDVKHMVKSENYVTDLLVSKDNKYEKSQSNVLSKRFTNPPTSKLINDKWVAETSEVLEYA
jgi:hypothetical protein